MCHLSGHWKRFDPVEIAVNMASQAIEHGSAAAITGLRSRWVGW